MTIQSIYWEIRFNYKLILPKGRWPAEIFWKILHDRIVVWWKMEIFSGGHILPCEDIQNLCWIFQIFRKNYLIYLDLLLIFLNFLGFCWFWEIFLIFSRTHGPRDPSILFWFIRIFEISGNTTDCFKICI